METKTLKTVIEPALIIAIAAWTVYFILSILDLSLSGNLRYGHHIGGRIGFLMYAFLWDAILSVMLVNALADPALKQTRFAGWVSFGVLYGILNALVPFLASPVLLTSVGLGAKRYGFRLASVTFTGLALLVLPLIFYPVGHWESSFLHLPEEVLTLRGHVLAPEEKVTVSAIELGYPKASFILYETPKGDIYLQVTSKSLYDWMIGYICLLPLVLFSLECRRAYQRKQFLGGVDF